MWWWVSMRSMRCLLSLARRARECGHGVLVVAQRPRGGLELGELVQNRLTLRGVAPDADALMGGGLPRGLVHHDRIPPDLPLEPRGRHGVERQFLVVGVLTDVQCHAEAEFSDPLIGRRQV